MANAEVHDYEPYYGPVADGKVAGFNSILTQYNNLFSKAYNIPDFNLLNQNLDSNQVNDGILLASIQNLHVGIPLGTLVQWEILQNFKQKIDLLVKVVRNNNSKIISNLLDRQEMKSMFIIPQVNDIAGLLKLNSNLSISSPHGLNNQVSRGKGNNLINGTGFRNITSSNFKLVTGPKGQRTFSTIIKTEKEKGNIKLNTILSTGVINPLDKFDITKDVDNIDTQLNDILNKLTDLTKLLVAYNIVLKNNVIETTIKILTKAIIDILNQTKLDEFTGGEIIKGRIIEIQNELNNTQKISVKSLVNRNSNKNKSIFNHDMLLESNSLIWEAVESWLEPCRKRNIEIRDKYIEKLADTCLIWLTLNKEKNVKAIRDEAKGIIETIFKENKSKKKGGRKNPKMLKPLTNSDYRNLIESEIIWEEESAIESANKEINNKLKVIFDISKDDDLEENIQQIF